MIEKAAHIRSLKDLRWVDRSSFSRIYWGAETCQKVIPTIGQTDRLFSSAYSRKFSVTLVFPFLTESGLAEALRVCSWAARNKLQPEVVVNDWGLLYVLRTSYQGVFKLALGRLLTRQQRIPMAQEMLEPQPPVAVRLHGGKKIVLIYHRIPNKKCRSAMRSSYINTPVCCDKLRDWGVERVELNNLVQGINFQGIKFKKTVYTPRVLISTTRYCPMETVTQKKERMSPCSWQCRSFVDLLTSRSLPFPLIKQGNSIFYENPVSESSLSPGIDRIVVQLQENERWKKAD